ncbi:MAG: hypothetical protein WBQ75_07555 [Acetobacteraceae bacterium]
MYEVRGFTLDAGALDPHAVCIAGTQCSLGVGSSVNQISRKFFGDDYADNEENWQKEHGCSPPYLLVLFGPTREYEISGNYYRIQDQTTVVTYDGFRKAKEELEAREDLALPPLISALACSFVFTDPEIRFIPTDRAIFGKTKDGRTIQDIRVAFSGFGYSSRRFEAEEVQTRLSDALRLAGEINTKVARFHHLALNESDPLKRFLYFFLAIEIQTHATFAAIDHQHNLSKLIVPPARAAASAKTLFGEQRNSWKLKDRFVWCVLCVWTDLSDSDVEELSRLKAVRDKIAHGSMSVPPVASVAVAERLATKLQRAGHKHNP